MGLNKGSLLPLKEQLLAKQIAVELAAVLGPMLQQQIDHMTKGQTDADADR